MAYYSGFDSNELVSAVAEVVLALLSWEKSSSSPIVVQSASLARAAALRTSALSLANTCSIELRSGEYSSRYSRLALAARMVSRIHAAL